MVARDAVDRDGHLLRILVDGDGDLGLGGARSKQHTLAKATRKERILTLASWPDCSAAHRPGTQYARNPVLVPAARAAIVNNSRA